MSKKEKRLFSKKRKLEALVNVTVLNDEDKNANTKEKRKRSLSESEDRSSDFTEEAAPVERTGDWSSEVKDDIKKLKEAFRRRRELNMTIPKLFLTLENIERPLKEEYQGEEKVSEKCRPVLFCSDLQRLLLYCIQGNMAAYKPRWCTLLRPTKVLHTVVIAVDDVGTTELLQYKDSFPHLQKHLDMSVEVACPMQYGRTVADELFNILVGREKLIGWKASEDSDSQSSDVCSRLELLLNPQQMVEEQYPMPVSHGRCSNYVFSTENSYKRVHEKSPLFALDCEMCLGSNFKHVLTRVAVVDDKLNVLYDSLVMPDVPIRDYLTKYSGITKKMLEHVTTSLEDVQDDLRKLFPPDAILCGQSLQGDLHALRMFHPYVIDTSVIYNLSGIRSKKTGLRKLTAHFLGRDIQNDPSGHNPCEDAIATMELVNLKLSQGLYFGDVMLGNPAGDVANSDAPWCSHDPKIGTENEKRHVIWYENDTASNECDNEKNKWSDGLKLVFFKRPHYVRNESFFRTAKAHKKSVVIVGREEDIKQYKDDTDTIVAETDKLIAKQIIASYKKYDMSYCNLNGFTRCLNRNLSEDQIKEKLLKVDHRIKKMTKALIPGTVLVIICTGRVDGDETHNATVFVNMVLH